MKSLGVRDVIGPIMIGPSSSHTAGALRIALMCRRLLAAEPRKVTFTLYGSFAHTYHGHGTDKALVAGMLGMEADDARIRDSFEAARENNLEFHFAPEPDAASDHPNTVDIDVVDANGATTSVRGESIGGGAALISRLNGIDVKLTGEYHSLVVRQRDVQGVLAHIATCLNLFDINIATTRLFRERKGEIAYTIMETDSELPEALAQVVAKNPNIFDVRVVKSDRASAAAHNAEDAAGAPCEENGENGEEGESAPDSCNCTLYAADRFAQKLSAEEAAECFENLDFAHGTDLIAYCEAHDIAISTAMLRRESCLNAANDAPATSTIAYLARALDVMRASVLDPIANPQKSMGGLLGGEAAKLSAFEEQGLADSLLARATTYAMAVLETNASMGRIVAAPTAGSSGVLPAMLLSFQDMRHAEGDQLIAALANAAAVGYLITRNATVSGAEGGCQAEVGAASAMAASAAVELMGGTPRMCLEAAANALAGVLGLVCDPVAGLVEAPCQKRNATGVANAIVSAQIALAGIGNLVDFDQTVEAMYRVGRALPFELRESALGGLAATPAACEFCAGCVH